MKYLPHSLSEQQIVDILSDLKHRVFPRPFERLGLSKTKCEIGAEIGVFEGSHALSLLQNSNVSKLYLIDPYEMYFDYLEGNKH